jgi:hypothetical protein
MYSSSAKSGKNDARFMYRVYRRPSARSNAVRVFLFSEGVASPAEPIVA